MHILKHPIPKVTYCRAYWLSICEVSSRHTRPGVQLHCARKIHVISKVAIKREEGSGIQIIKILRYFFRSTGYDTSK